MTTVINIRDAPANWRKDPQYVYIGRPTLFGNPCPVKGHNSREAIQYFTWYFYGRVQYDDKFRSAVLALKNHTLVCFCRPLPCHGDVIERWLDAQD